MEIYFGEFFWNFLGLRVWKFLHVVYFGNISCSFLLENVSHSLSISLSRLKVECPNELYNALVSTWDQNPQYVDVCDIIVNDLGDDEEDDQEELDEEDRQDPTLVHTFYR